MEHQGDKLADTKITAGYRIVIPRVVREKLKLRVGQKLHIYLLDGSIRLSVPRPVSELRGMAKGLKWSADYRDHTERF